MHPWTCFAFPQHYCTQSPTTDTASHWLQPLCMCHSWYMLQHEAGQSGNLPHRTEYLIFPLTCICKTVKLVTTVVRKPAVPKIILQILMKKDYKTATPFPVWPSTEFQLMQFSRTHALTGISWLFITSLQCPDFCGHPAYLHYTTNYCVNTINSKTMSDTGAYWLYHQPIRGVHGNVTCTSTTNSHRTAVHPSSSITCLHGL